MEWYVLAMITILTVTQLIRAILDFRRNRMLKKMLRDYANESARNREAIRGVTDAIYKMKYKLRLVNDESNKKIM